VAKAHRVVEDRDSERVLVLIVEDEEVAGHDLMGATEPPPTAGQVRRDSAVKQDFRGLVAGSR
jgi:hypothetical protein